MNARSVPLSFQRFRVFAAASRAIAASAVVLASSAAAASPEPSIDARTWRPSTDPTAGLAVESPAVPGAWMGSIGIIANYTLDPVTLRSSNGDTRLRPITDALNADVVAAIGLGAHLSIGVDVPLVVVQAGDGLPSSAGRTRGVPSTALGDIALTGKYALVRNENGGIGAAVLANVTLPTGVRTSFLGEGAVTVGGRLLVEESLVIAGVQASLGYQGRTQNRTWPNDAAGDTFGGQLPFTLGAWFLPKVLGIDDAARQRWELAFHGSLPGGPVGPFGIGAFDGSAALTPLMIGASDRIALGHYQDLYTLVGADFGLDRAVGTSILRGVVSIGWTPRSHDKDHDGVPDDVDQCPTDPEDRDGFEDSDGCPDVDNDDDGIVDKEDACPNVAGVETKDPKTNGCPAPAVPAVPAVPTAPAPPAVAPAPAEPKAP